MKIKKLTETSQDVCPESRVITISLTPVKSIFLIAIETHLEGPNFFVLVKLSTILDCKAVICDDAS